jgi:hypothetical protein
MKTNIMVHLEMERDILKVYIITLMETVMMVNGKIMKCMEKAYDFNLIEIMNVHIII